ncbi:MAG TPA: hypothetical protein VIY47_16185 [Ignavibacteriaceae bacterium]
MKEITYIQFPSGWRPPAYKNLDIKCTLHLGNYKSKNGNEYSLLKGVISDEDATFILLADPGARISNIKVIENDSRNIKKLVPIEGEESVKPS